MTRPTVSVVIVSQGRPEALARCVLGVSQLFYDPFEIVVVADEVGCKAVSPWSEHIKVVPFDRANISAARNLGIARASGEIIAFIDDDAVPEPSWLTYLIAAFDDPTVDAAGGYVRGRNGISYQWQGRSVAPDGSTQALHVPWEGAHVPEIPPQSAVKTEGTNMAVRRRVLVSLGGFDEAYCFYLDETDLNLRLAAAGHRTALVPMAQVHHAFAASTRRTEARVPRTLFEIAASIAVLHRKNDIAPLERNKSRTDQRQRLLRHMVAGRLLPSEVGRILRTFDDGWEAGRTRNTGKVATIPASRDDFLSFATCKTDNNTTFRGWIGQRNACLRRSAAAVSEGKRVSLFLFSMLPFRHRVTFDAGGFWVQTGGLFGKSDRAGEWFKGWTITARHSSEVSRVQPYRFPTD